LNVSLEVVSPRACPRKGLFVAIVIKNEAARR
jgi:hypothetical protein